MEMDAEVQYVKVQDIDCIISIYISLSVNVILSRVLFKIWFRYCSLFWMDSK